ncbi:MULTISPECIES: DUF5677 domain-containing protein [unclassified Streptomyces]|uniref:DUF5677 domain-containing protein n=1 Tax=unclassified Streptomyces TaxID=2593676 RepID=UPI0036E9C1FB
MKPLHKLLAEVAAAADGLVLATPVDPDDLLIRFDTEILVRAINSLKSVQALLEHGHWEHAAGITRQLFELLVNMEYLGAQPSRFEATFEYCHFGVLQFMREKHRQLLYNKETGRPVEAERLAFLEKMLDSTFDQFKGQPRADGTTRWVPSWSRKSTRVLADLSPDKMRAHQYEHLFTSWSEQAHAAPRSLIENLFHNAGEQWVEEVFESDSKKIIESASMTLMMFLSLWRVLPHAVPLSSDQVLSWTRRMMEIVAVPEFDLLPGYRNDESSSAFG